MDEQIKKVSDKLNNTLEQTEYYKKKNNELEENIKILQREKEYLENLLKNTSVDKNNQQDK